MNEEIKNVENVDEITEEVVTEENKTKESKLKRFSSGVVGFGKKHGKAILSGVVLGAVAVAGYALGRNSFADDDVEYESDDESDDETNDGTDETETNDGTDE